MVKYTYRARLVHNFCQDNGLDAKAHSGETPGYTFFPVDSGIRITFKNAKRERVYLSIQTHPYWAKTQFAETAVQSDKLRAVVYPSQLGYHGELIKHRDPNDLFEHIKSIKSKLEDEDFFQHVFTDTWPQVDRPPVVLPPSTDSPDSSSSDT